MLSGLVAATAYVSDNQLAFVEAQVLLNIDFGSVFPGQVVTESFTIVCTESLDYSLTLQSVDGFADMRGNLLVAKAPGEADVDGPISGAPDYTGPGSFTKSSDESDTWKVTFFVPDVTLPKDNVVEYGCQIAIEPIVK
jgi:hypothetical protein